MKELKNIKLYEDFSEEEGDRISNVEILTRDNYAFLGWGSDEFIFLHNNRSRYEVVTGRIITEEDFMEECKQAALEELEYDFGYVVKNNSEFARYYEEDDEYLEVYKGDEITRWEDVFDKDDIIEKYGEKKYEEVVNASGYYTSMIATYTDINTWNRNNIDYLVIENRKFECSKLNYKDYSGVFGAKVDKYIYDTLQGKDKNKMLDVCATVLNINYVLEDCLNIIQHSNFDSPRGLELELEFLNEAASYGILNEDMIKYILDNELEVEYLSDDVKDIASVAMKGNHKLR